MEILAAQELYDGLHPVMCPGASLRAHTDLADRDIDIVIDDDYIRRLDLKIRSYRSYTLSGIVHECSRLDDDRILPFDPALTVYAVKLGAVQLDPALVRQHLCSKESAVMPCVGVLVAGIAQPCNKPHIRPPYVCCRA